MSDIFISYGRPDQTFVEDLRRQFQAEGLSVWHDKDIPGGEEWYKVIVEHVRRCQVMVVILSAHSAASQWVNLECGMAIGLNKPILPLLIDPQVVTIPPYLSSLQVTTYQDETTLNQLIHLIRTRYLPNHFWHHLFETGVDIGVSLTDFAGREGISRRTITVALDLQARLVSALKPHQSHANALRITLADASGHGLDASRNWLLLGGPGGFPYVREVLHEWADYPDTLDNGYRFVTEKGRFTECLYLRDSTDERLGIETIRSGRTVGFDEVRTPEKEKDGASYGVIYTRGLGVNSVSTNKIIILAPFSRYMLDAMVDFLLDHSKRENWLKQVAQCGDVSETLFHFSFTLGRSPQLARFDPPRPLNG